MWASVVDKEGRVRRVATLNTIAICSFALLLFRTWFHSAAICNILGSCPPPEKVTVDAGDELVIESYAKRLASKRVVEDLFLKEMEEERNAKKRKVLLVSQPRSGSSFLGEVFNMQESVFYMYEPLHAQNIFVKSGLIPSKSYNEAASTFVKDIMNCDLTHYSDFLSFIGHPDLSSIHYRLMSRALASPPFCTIRVPPNISNDFYSEHCANLDPVLVSASCKRRQIVVVKDLMHRLPEQSILGLRSFLKDDQVKIVWLVRDPRAVLWSMSHLGWFGSHFGAFAADMPRAAEAICNLLSSSYESFQRFSRIATGLVIVRYEDLVSRPVEIVGRLFEMLDMELNEQTLLWLLENTRGQLDNLDLLQAYSISLRNASHSLNFWRTVINMGHVLLVQTLCGDVMNRLGYKLFWSREHLTNLSQAASHDDILMPNVLRASD